MTDTVHTMAERGRALRREIDARQESVPNLRDYGLSKRAEYERAVADYHAVTERMWHDYQELAQQRHALRSANG